MSANIVKRGIDLGIVTRQPDALLKFYQDTLGLPLEATIPMPGGGTMHRLKAGDSIIKIVEPEVAPPADAPPGGIRGATGYRYWTITVDNMAACVAACADAGYKVIVAEKVVRPGVTIAIVEDPDGNWVELLENSAG
jgi:glyoxylase I family protein